MSPLLCGLLSPDSGSVLPAPTNPGAPPANLRKRKVCAGAQPARGVDGQQRAVVPEPSQKPKAAWGRTAHRPGGETEAGRWVSILLWRGPSRFPARGGEQVSPLQRVGRPRACRLREGAGRPGRGGIVQRGVTFGAAFEVVVTNPCLPGRKVSFFHTEKPSVVQASVRPGGG